VDYGLCHADWTAANLHVGSDNGCDPATINIQAFLQ
jgi:hypothetical protein